MEALIYQSELDLISQWVLDYPELETGGDFFGFWTKKGSPVVQYVLGPGSGATRTSTSFYQDIPYLRACGAILNKQHGLEHIGAWHSHHKLNLDHPSSGDVNTMRNALRDGSLPRFLISISNIERSSRVSIKGFLFLKDYNNDYINCSWQVLEGMSPMRSSVNSWNNNLFKSSRVSKSAAIGAPAREVSSERVPEKPDLDKDSFWTTQEGRVYLKNVFDKLKNRSELSDVEILQLEDKTIAISFIYDRATYEIRFPKNFPSDQPEVIEKGSVNDGVIGHLFKSNKKLDKKIQKMIYSLGLVERDSVIIIRHES